MKEIENYIEIFFNDEIIIDTNFNFLKSLMVMNKFYNSPSSWYRDIKTDIDGMFRAIDVFIGWFNYKHDQIPITALKLKNITINERQVIKIEYQDRQFGYGTGFLRLIITSNINNDNVKKMEWQFPYHNIKSVIIK